MELYLKQYDHPDWFRAIIEDLHGNFNIAYWKIFFDEEIIQKDIEKLNYCIGCLDRTIAKMQSITKKEFFEFIIPEITNTWCDISIESSSEEWMDDPKGYNEHYIGTLLQLRQMMTEE